MVLSLFPWRDMAELYQWPLLTSHEATYFADGPPFPTKEVKQDGQSMWTLYQEDRKYCLELYATL